MKIPTLREHTDRFIRRVFKLCDNCPTKTAAMLGIGRATAYRQAYRLGIMTVQPADVVAEKRRKNAEKARLVKYEKLYERPFKTL
jgi:hypothetical protein